MGGGVRRRGPAGLERGAERWARSTARPRRDGSRTSRLGSGGGRWGPGPSEGGEELRDGRRVRDDGAKDESAAASDANAKVRVEGSPEQRSPIDACGRGVEVALENALPVRDREDVRGNLFGIAGDRQRRGHDGLHGLETEDLAPVAGGRRGRPARLGGRALSGAELPRGRLACLRWRRRLGHDAGAPPSVPRCIPAVASASAGDSSGGALDASASSRFRRSPRRASHFITRSWMRRTIRSSSARVGAGAGTKRRTSPSAT